MGAPEIPTRTSWETDCFIERASETSGNGMFQQSRDLFVTIRNLLCCGMKRRH